MINRLQRLTMPMLLTSVALFLFTTGNILFRSPEDGGKSFVLLALAVAMFINSCTLLPENIEKSAQPTTKDKVAAWIFLLFFFLSFAAFHISASSRLIDFANTMPATIFFMALFCFWGGRRSAMLFLLPTMLCTIIIPNRDVLALLLSYPLRLLSTIISVESLQIFSFNIEYHLTSIRLPGSGIAITDACSGIEQLEIMLFLSYLLVKMQHQRKRWAFLHYLFIFPTIVLVNSIRITITILLFYYFGQRAFADSIHLALGYLLVIAVVFLLWSIGALFPDAEADKGSQEIADNKA